MFLVATQTSSLHAGQEAIIPLSDLLTPSHLVAVVEVKEVTQVDVSTGRGQLTSVYVAQAAVEQHIKPDIFPAPGDRTIAIVGSTVPRSSAVWKPIEKKRYLAFLTSEQGHFRYSLNMAFREIDDKGTVRWYEYKNGRPTDFGRVPLKQAIKRIREVQQELTAKAKAAARLNTTAD